MVLFWTLATLMTLVALVIVLVPLLRTHAAPAGPTAHAAALDVLRGQRQEIEADIASGTLPAEAREEVMAELLERAGQDLAAEPAERTSAPRKPWITASVLAAAVPALAFGLYAAIGMPSASDPRMLQAATSPANEQEMVAMVESLARKVRERPEDAQGWALLGRSMAAIGRFQEAADALEHVAKLAPGDPQVLADWADVLGMAQGRSLLGRPRELARQALDIDPKHPKALALMGTAELDAGDYAAAVGYWQRLHDQFPADSPDAKEALVIIAEIRGRAAAAGKPLPSTEVAGKSLPSVAARQTPVPAPSTGAAAVSGSVQLAPPIATRLTGGETLFVLARAEGGPRVPLAVVRTSANALPYSFTLDDSQSMAPGMNISSTPAIRLEARISRSGNVTPQPGDLVGTSDVVKPGARDVKIVVDKVLP
jgi:cytochrome c-type biogenesis protein CcmH